MVCGCEVCGDVWWVDVHVCVVGGCLCVKCVVGGDVQWVDVHVWGVCVCVSVMCEAGCLCVCVRLDACV